MSHCGIFYNDCYYIMKIHANHSQQSLEDNVYFTLKDLYANLEEPEYCFRATIFMNELTNNTFYEDRTNDFQYTDVLNDRKYLFDLRKWLNYITPADFEFENVSSDSNLENPFLHIDMNHFMPFDDWWKEFDELRKQIDEKCRDYTPTTSLDTTIADAQPKTELA